MVSGDRQPKSTVCVTGAASGIGRQVVKDLSVKGFNIVAVDRNPDGLQTLTQEYSKQSIITVCGDLSKKKVADKVLQTSLERFGKIDGTVFSAGTSTQGALAEVSEKEVLETFHNNFLCHFYLTQEILKYANKEKDKEQALSLVYIASKAGVVPSKGFGTYPIFKAAEIQLCKMAAIEGAADNVRANTINPGSIIPKSQFWDNKLKLAKAAKHQIRVDDLEEFYAERTLLKLTLQVEDISNAAMYLLSSSSRAITGSVLPIDGGLVSSFSR